MTREEDGKVSLQTHFMHGKDRKTELVFLFFFFFFFLF